MKNGFNPNADTLLVHERFLASTRRPMERVFAIFEFGKSGEDVLKTAARKGHSVNDWSASEVYDVPIDKALTKKDIDGEIATIIDEYTGTLKRKDVVFHGGRIEDMDSTNMSHASAYYVAILEVPKDVAEEFGRDTWPTLAEVKKHLGLTD